MKFILSLMLTASLLSFNTKPVIKPFLPAYGFAGPYPSGSYDPNSTVAISSNGAYQLVYQDDGNFVLYDSHHVGLWCSGTVVSNAASVIFGINGSIRVYSNGGQTINWDANVAFTQQPYGPFFWVLQDDGNFVRYAGTPGHITPGTTSVSTNTEHGQRSPHYNTIQ